MTILALLECTSLKELLCPIASRRTACRTQNLQPAGLVAFMK